MSITHRPIETEDSSSFISQYNTPHLRKRRLRAIATMLILCALVIGFCLISFY